MTIGIWGDSITYGSCDTEALGWAGRLRKSLPTNDWHVLYSLGICGDTTAGLLKRFTAEAQAIRPTHVIFAIGINDSKFPGGETNLVPIADYRTNLSALLLEASKYTTQITVISATPVDEALCSGPINRFSNKTISEYNEVMKSCAAIHATQYVDVFEVIDPTTDLADGLHPNTQGYEKLCQALKTTIITK